MAEQFHYRPPGSIFVFGSNLAGYHGAGAAYTAKKEFGAIQGQGIGRQGDSYAIPTKDYDVQTLPLNEIEVYVNKFLTYARRSPNLLFYVTKIGCGLAGYTEDLIKPLFKDAPENCLLPDGWRVDNGTKD